MSREGKAKISIKVDIKGKGTLLIDGKDYSSSVYAMQINTRAQKLTTAVVEFYVDELEVEAEAITKRVEG